MKTKQDINFVDKVIVALRKSAVELEEFQVQATLGKAEAKDKYEEVKKKFNLFLHDSEFNIIGLREKIEELNYIWKEKISNLHRYSTQEDLEFIRAWLRSQYADSIRSGSRGAENEDFEKIGTRFHTWVKDNHKKIGLSNSNSYYHFIKGDFEFYSSLYEKIKSYESKYHSEIERLNPKPGSSYSNNSRSIEHVVPDFTIKITEGELELSLNGRNAPELHVSRPYNEMLKGYKASKEKTKSQKDAVQFIKQKLDAAKWFIDAIKQRQHTLFITMSTIMYYQKKYFLSGDEQQLRPMILKDIADKIEMDVSTVSRVANSKYVDTPYGTKLIKEFFSESMTNDQGEEVSTREIKSILETVIAEEDKKKPLTDDKLAVILKEKGYPIARRTIAKYREQLEIPVARLRKEI